MVVQVATTLFTKTVRNVAVTSGYDWLLLIRVSVVVSVVGRMVV